MPGRPLVTLPMVDVIILAGGKGRRLGRDKALVPVAGEPLLARVLRRLQPLEGDRLIVIARGRDPFPFPLPQNARVVEDRVADAGPLGGLYTGLVSAAHPICAAVSVDLPFVDPGVVGVLAGLLEESEAVVPVVDGVRQPLHAAYRSTCWQRLEPWVTAAEHPSLAELLDHISCRWVEGEELRRLDPELRSFFNLNYPADLDQAELLIAAGAD